MKFSEFKISGLFGLYNHEIKFPQEDIESKASIIMIYGSNGVGKTTVLRMIDGLMMLNFDIFRKVRFDQCSLKFSNRSSIKIKSVYNGKNLSYLLVSYKKLSVKLHSKNHGILNDEEIDNQSNFISLYEKDLVQLSFEFTNAERLNNQNQPREERNLDFKDLKGKRLLSSNRHKNNYLAKKVKGFLIDSQVNYEKYFLKSEPELFDVLIKNIENSNKIQLDSKVLITRLKDIKATDKSFQTDRLGIVKEKWDDKKLSSILNDIKQEGSVADKQKLTVINSYVEVLESRLIERKDLAERLLIFEETLNSFFIDKRISILPKEGFRIKSDNGDYITEDLLSTGEYHLLYLFVLALCTKVKGSIIAIDEPEMSMHISWQRKLVRSLIKCASKANPQFILATHSPDIAANHDNSFFTSKIKAKNE